MRYTKPNIETSALITIDTQNDFTLEGAPVEIPGTREILPNMVRLLKRYRSHALPIIHIVRIYSPDGSNVDLCRKEMVENGAKIVTPGSQGVELAAPLLPDPSLRLDCDLLLRGEIQKFSENEAVIYKSRWGAFYKTPLEPYLHGLGVDTLVFCGCNFPNCPRTSIYQGSERDYRLVLIEDALSGLYGKGRGEMVNIGVHVMATDQLLKQMTGKKRGRT